MPNRNEKTLEKPKAGLAQDWQSMHTGVTGSFVTAPKITPLGRQFLRFHQGSSSPSTCMGRARTIKALTAYLETGTVVFHPKKLCKTAPKPKIPCKNKPPQGTPQKVQRVKRLFFLLATSSLVRWSAQVFWAYC